ncbi:MAG: hypothetical protein PQJ46_02805, partial [Spirochaetales bacterium]|nr:hypothetical protein [Spirochaetales bacterium]
MIISDRLTFKVTGLLSLLLFVVVFSSCSVKNEITLSADGSGTASTNTVLEDSLVFYIQSLAELTGEDSSDSLFDTDAIKSEMEKNPGIKVNSIDSIDDKKITAEIEFDNIEELIKESEKTLNKKVVSFKQNGDVKEIKIYIDIDNFKDIAPLFPIVDNPLFETFGPLENQEISEDEYLEMMDYALGDGGGTLIKNSIITTSIKIN